MLDNSDGGHEGGGSVPFGDNPGDGGADKGSDPSKSSGGGGDQTAQQLTTWYSENRALFEKKGWRDPQTALREVAKSYSHAERALSGKAPAKSSGGDGDSVVPTNPAGYELKLPGDFPTDGFYNKNFAETFKTWAHKAGLSTKQAQSLHDLYAIDAHEAFSRSQSEATSKLNERIAKTHEALTKSWGSEESPAFKRSMEMARRAVSNLDPDLKQGLMDSGILVNHNGTQTVTNAAVLKALAKAGSALYQEDSIYGQTQHAKNPFDPKTPDTTAQGKVIRENPGLARSLIQAAGPEAVREWGWWLNKKGK